MRYKAFLGRQAIASGYGQLVNMSSSGILVEIGKPLKRGTQVELSVAWPVPLNGETPMQLWISGTTVRTQDRQVAFCIARYEFRTRGINGALSSGHQCL